VEQSLATAGLARPWGRRLVRRIRNWVEQLLDRSLMQPIGAALDLQPERFALHTAEAVHTERAVVGPSMNYRRAPE